MADAEQKRLARESNAFLWKLTIDGQCRTPKSGRLDIWGPLPEECYRELQAMLDRWQEKGLL